jgi:uncharacterized protein YgiM (DUF1202 family)
MMFIVALAGAFGSQVSAQSDPTPLPDSGVVRAEDLYVRSGPGEQYRPVGRLSAGDTVRAIRRSVDGAWVLIPYGSGVGWVRRDLLVWNVDINALPPLDANVTPSPNPAFYITPTAAAASATPAGSYITVDGIGVYLRAGPGRDYQRLGFVNNGTVVEPVGRNQTRTWIMIRTESGFAWIGTRFIVLAVDPETLPILSETALTPSATADHIHAYRNDNAITHPNAYRDANRQCDVDNDDYRDD